MNTIIIIIQVRTYCWLRHSESFHHVMKNYVVLGLHICITIDSMSFASLVSSMSTSSVLWFPFASTASRMERCEIPLSPRLKVMSPPFHESFPEAKLTSLEGNFPSFITEK